MQDVELFLSMAEIAGVFVGFGALISVRSSATLEASEINSIRWPVTIAIWVVIAALVPVILSRYDITGHQLWLVGSFVALVLLVAMIVVFGRSPENRADVADSLATTPRVLLVVEVVSTFWLPMAALILALALVVLGPFPAQEPALYLTAVGLGLFMGAMGLFVAVFWQRRPQPGSDRAALPAGGGSSA